MSRNYWDTDRDYKQPDSAQLRKNASLTEKKEKQKGVSARKRGRAGDLKVVRNNLILVAGDAT